MVLRVSRMVMPPPRRVDELRGQRGDAAQPLQKVQRGSLGVEQRVRVAAHVGDDFAGLHARAVAPPHLEHRLADRAGGTLRRPRRCRRRRDPTSRGSCRGRAAPRDRRGAGRVAAAAILGERLANEIAIRLGRQSGSTMTTPRRGLQRDLDRRSRRRPCSISASARDAAFRSRSTSFRHAIASSVA